MRANAIDAYVISGGLREWMKAGYEIEPVPKEDLVLLPTFG